jgi:hypothetical protein
MNKVNQAVSPKRSGIILERALVNTVRIPEITAIPDKNTISKFARIPQTGIV